MRVIPAGCHFWPGVGQQHAPGEIIRMYADGFAGAWSDEAAASDRRVAIANAGFHPYARQCFALIQNDGVGKLSLTFPAVTKLFPNAFPGPAQEIGDCVSHGSKNAALASLCNEVAYGKLDEISGMLEGAPEVGSEGEKNGVLSTEYLYWWRGYNGDGWDCDTAAEMIRLNGMLLRKNYDAIGIDLTKYSGRLAHKFGAVKPGDKIASEGRIHPVRTTTDIETFEELRSAVANGYGIATCGSEGFADVRDENGCSSRSGSWAHAMAYWGVDDREEIRRLYSGPLVLVGNSWGIWNSGPRKILGTQIEIPHGCFWARWRDVSNRRMIAYSSVAGWPKKQLPDYGVSIAG